MAYGNNRYGGGGSGPAGGSNTIMIVALGIVLLLVSSSAFGLVGYFQGWFGSMGSAAAPAVDPSIDPLTGLPYASAGTTVTDPTAAASAGGFSGLTTKCSLSYKPNKDVYNSAVPPFDPSACQGVQMEANCQSWLSTQQGSSWKWQKTGELDGCVPVAPDVSMSSTSAPVYGTDAGTVVVTTAPGVVINQSGGDAQAQAGGYGKGGRWRNTNDSKKIITAARKGTLPKAKVTTKPAAKRPVTPVKKPAARAGPTPYSTPAFAEHSPYTEGLINYSMI